MPGSTPPDRRDPEATTDASGQELDTVVTRSLDPSELVAMPPAPLPPTEVLQAPEVAASAPAARRAVSTGGGTGAHGDATASSSILTDESRFASPLDALHQDEIRRSRLLARFGLILAGAVSVALLFLPGDRRMLPVIYGAVAIASIGNGWLYFLSGSPERYQSRGLAIIWVMNAVAVSIGVIYFGVFSAAAIVIMVGIYFMALGESFALAVAVYLTCAALRGLVAVMVALGLLDDPGLVHADYLSREVLLILETLIQLILLAAFVMARASRRVTLSAVTDYERVVRALAQREVLLHEARQDLERALQLGGVGRFTGQSVGSFRLGPILGRGSMGEVYEATRVTTGEPAAVKLLQPASMGNPSYLMRFLREVEVAAALDVAHVVRVLEIGNASAPVPYLAMERLRGLDLAQLLRDQRRLGAPEVIELIAQAGRGIDAAGRAGVVHRDLKPQNLFLAEQPAGPPIWKVLDFGVSKLLDDRGTLTQGQVVGTPVYMAPEQAQGHDVDPRADLYALAAIAYRCLTGHLPFRARDVPTIMYQVVYRMPARPGSLAELPPDVDDALLIAMAKNPAHRFASAALLAAALEDALGGRLADDLRARARELGRVHPWRAGS